MVEIIPGKLYQGSFWEILDVSEGFRIDFEKLRELGINTIVNVSSDHFYKSDGFEYYHLILHNLPLLPKNMRAIERLVDRVAETLRGDGVAYIHCSTGVDRSMLIAALIYMKLTCKSGAEAVAKMQELNEFALQNDVFRRYLEGLPGC